MEFSNILSDGCLRSYNENGILCPKPNGIQNVEHLISFIESEASSWQSYCKEFEDYTNGMSFESKLMELTSLKRARVYIKSLYNISNYYCSCYELIEKIIDDLIYVGKKFELTFDNPNLIPHGQFGNKVRDVRNISFVHAESKKEAPVNKIAATNWMPTLLFKNNQLPSCNDYRFAVTFLPNLRP